VASIGGARGFTATEQATHQSRYNERRTSGRKPAHENNLNDARALVSASRKTANLSRKALDKVEEQCLPRPERGVGRCCSLLALGGACVDSSVRRPFFARYRIGIRDPQQHPMR